MADNNVQHGIDDNPSNDPQKGATLGGLAVGAAAGSMAGPALSVAAQRSQRWTV